MPEFVDGSAAAQTLLSFETVEPGYCLRYVWAAYQEHGAVSQGLGYPTAYAGWLKSPGKHPDDMNPPPGVPVWFGPRPGSDAGDVVISLGGGAVAATDWPRNGVTGVTTIEARMRQIRRPYLGWTETILGQKIAYKGAEPAPVITEDERELMRIFSVGLSFYLGRGNGIVGIRNPDELVLLRAYLRPEELSLNELQRDIINYYLTAPGLSWSDLNPGKG